MQLNISKLLLVAPHPDDAELGAGGTIARLADMGCEVLVLLLCDRDEPAWLEEAKAAAADLHETVHVETLHLTPYHMHTERQSLMRSLEQYREDFKPDCVMAPAAGDENQDHVTAMNECRRVYKGCTLLGYEIIRSNKAFRPRLFSKIYYPHLKRKGASIEHYTTQKDKYYCFFSVIRGLAMTRGAACECEFAEAFDVEWIVT